MSRTVTLVVALAVIMLLSACGRAPTEASAPELVAPRGATEYLPESCPERRIVPEPYRPVTQLQFTLASDLRSVTGHETVRFVPDRDVDELVFRLWPNLPGRDESLDVTAAVSGTDTDFTTESAGGRGDTQGTLLRIPLSRTAPAGESLTAAIDFTVQLGAAATQPRPDAGSDGDTAWWAGAHPMLAWVHGDGWQTDPGGDIAASYAVSEAADTTITVDAPQGLAVLATGGGDQPLFTPQDSGDGYARWTARSDRARDVAVAVGRFVSHHTAVNHTPVTVAAVDPETELGEIADTATATVETLAADYGPYPFDALKIVLLPVDDGEVVTAAEVGFVAAEAGETDIGIAVARQWFSGLLGANAAEEPWLNESLPRFAIAGDDEAPAGPAEAIGMAVTDYGSQAEYVAATGVDGPAVLAAARASEPTSFDTALKCLIADRAWRVITAADLAVALRPADEATAILEAAGAWPTG